MFVLPIRVVLDVIDLLRRNPQLWRVTLAAGLQMSAAEIARAFDMGPDPYDMMKNSGGGAALEAWFGLAESGMALIAAPAFGYFTDKVDRRIAYVVFGIISMTPTWVYWFVDLNSPTALWANHIAMVFAASGTTTNVGFALSVDVTPFEDRELAAGAFFGMKHLITLVLAPLPCLLVLVLNVGGLKSTLTGCPKAVLVYQLILFTCYLFMVTRVKHEDRGCEDNCECNEPAVSRAQTQSSTQPTSRLKAFICLGIKMVKLMWNDCRLWRLCVAGFVLSFCRTAALGNTGQFFFQAMRLDGSKGKYVDLNVIRNFAGHLAIPPSFMAVGYLAKKTGTLRTLRRSIPLSAFLLSLGALMMVAPNIWFGMLIEFVLALTDFFSVPLNRLVAGVARPGQIGRWLNSLGVAMEVGSILGYLLIILLNTSFWRLTGRDMHLWPYYPVCGLLMLISLLPLLADKIGPPNSRIGWGAAAGLPEEVLHNTLGVVRAAQVWRKKAQQRAELEASASKPEFVEVAGVGFFASMAKRFHVRDFGAESMKSAHTEDDSSGMFNGISRLFGGSPAGRTGSRTESPSSSSIPEDVEGLGGLSCAIEEAFAEAPRRHPEGESADSESLRVEGRACRRTESSEDAIRLEVSEEGINRLPR